MKIDELIARSAASGIEAAIERLDGVIASGKPVGVGEIKRAKYTLPPSFDERFIERFSDGAPGFEYWCYYAVLCADLQSRFSGLER